MNYQDYVEYTYSNYSTDLRDGDAILFGYSGNTKTTQFDGSVDFETCFNKLVASFHSDYGYDDDLAFTMLAYDGTTYIFASTQIDYFYFTSHGNSQVTTFSYDGSVDISQIDFENYLNGFDLGVTGGYYLGNADGSTLPSNVGQYSSTMTNNQSVVFDYTNLTYNIYNEDYRQQWPITLVRGNQQAYYNFGVAIHSDNVIDIGYGRPLYDIYKSGYASGYGNGYTAGRTDYYGSGYINTGNATTTAFDYIGNAFTAVGGIMSLEVLPNISLGLCFSIPLVLILIMTIFKLVKK